MSDYGPNDETRRWFMREYERRFLELLEKLETRVSTNEAETQKEMGFILEQQAQLVVNQQKAEERTAQIEGLVIRLASVTHTGFQELRDSVATAQIKTEERLSKLAEAQARADRNIATLARVVADLDSRLSGFDGQ